MWKAEECISKSAISVLNEGISSEISFSHRRSCLSTYTYWLIKFDIAFLTVFRLTLLLTVESDLLIESDLYFTGF